jgi:SHS2 domain-containing protein
MVDNTSGHRSVLHTADLRIEAWSPSREGCVGEAVLGTVERFLDTSGARPQRIRRCRLTGERDDDLLLAALEGEQYLRFFTEDQTRSGRRRGNKQLTFAIKCDR